MSELTPEIAADVVAACQAGAEEAQGALSRTFDAELEMSVGEAGTLDPAALPAGFDGPGLAVLMTFGEVGAIAALPAASGLVPDWVANPDATGESKLSTLAQELSMLLIPETLMAEDFKAAWVADLGAAFGRAGLGEATAIVPLRLKAGEAAGELTLAWPAASPGELFDSAPEAAEADAEGEAETPAEEQASAAAEPESPPPPRRTITDMSQLPNYGRSLLQVEVPVTVRLASKQQKIQEIVELGPGAIITFDQSCDDPVELTVGDETVAFGEAVKVGEKFGIRISEMILPDESFKTIPGSGAAKQAS